LRNALGAGRRDRAHISYFREQLCFIIDPEIGRRSWNRAGRCFQLFPEPLHCRGARSHLKNRWEPRLSSRWLLPAVGWPRPKLQAWSS